MDHNAKDEDEEEEKKEWLYPSDKMPVLQDLNHGNSPQVHQVLSR